MTMEWNENGTYDYGHGVVASIVPGSGHAIIRCSVKSLTVYGQMLGGSESDIRAKCDFICTQLASFAHNWVLEVRAPDEVIEDQHQAFTKIREIMGDTPVVYDLEKGDEDV